MAVTLADLGSLRGSELLDEIGGALLYEAARIRSIECVLRPGAWDEQRASAHNALCAAAAIVGWIVDVGAKSVEKKERPPNFVMTAADKARESLILELTTQQIDTAELKETVDATVA